MDSGMVRKEIVSPSSLETHSQSLKKFHRKENFHRLTYGIKEIWGINTEISFTLWFA